MTRMLLRVWQAPFVGLLLATVACSARSSMVWSGTSSTAEFVVPLAQAPDLTPDRWRGMSNIFFDSIPPSLRDSVRFGGGWHAIEIAEIVASSSMRSIRAIRFTRGAGGEAQYAVDTTGDLDFRTAPLLVFERRGAVRVAKIDLTVRSASGGLARVPYQVLVADDGYTYARIADYRSGSFRIDGQTFAVTVRNRGRSHPFYEASEQTVFLVDLNADGVFAEQASVTVGGQVLAPEQVMPRVPFVVNGRAFEVANIDSAGTALWIRPSKRTVAAATHFRAPEIRADLLKGGEFRLSKQIGKVVLVEFWATDCAYSEKVRAAANALAASRGERFTWIAVSRERDRTAIEKHLAKAPMMATITLADSAAWDIYNPTGATPFFVVIDQRGIIQFTAAGASAIDAVTAMVDRLLQSSLSP